MTKEYLVPRKNNEPTNEEISNGISNWMNGVDFKQHFKNMDAIGESLVFEVGDWREYCEGADTTRP